MKALFRERRKSKLPLGVIVERALQPMLKVKVAPGVRKKRGRKPRTKRKERGKPRRENAPFHRSAIQL